MRYVERRRPSGIFQVRIAVPVELRAQVGTRELVKSLKTRDEAEAFRRGHPVILEFLALLEAARTPLGGLHIPDPAPPAVGVAREPIRPAAAATAIERWKLAEIDAAHIAHFNEQVETFDISTPQYLELSQLRYRLQCANWSEIEGFDATLARALSSQGVPADEGHPALRNLRQEFCAAWNEVENRRHEFSIGIYDNAVTDGDAQPACGATTVPVTTDQPAVRLGELLARFLSAKRSKGSQVDDNREKTLQTYVRRLSEFLADPPVSEIKTSDIDGFLRNLRKYPNTKRPDVANMPFMSAINLAEAARISVNSSLNNGEEPDVRDVQLANTLSDRTVWANWFVFYKEIFEWAVSRDYLQKNPVSDAMPRKPRHVEKETTYEANEVSEIFSKPMFHGAAKIYNEHGKVWGYRQVPGKFLVKDANYWLPILSIWTGMRLEECGSLRRRDVYLEDGIDYIVVPIADTETKLHHRRIPISTGLRALGFLDYALARSPEEFIFPELAHDPGGSKSSTRYYTKWFGLWCDANSSGSVKINLPDKNFHSFRHTWKRIARMSPVKEEIHDIISAHKGDAGVNPVARGYGNAVPLQSLAEAMEQIVPYGFPKLP